MENKKTILKVATGTALGAAVLSTGVLLSSNTVHASTWHANTPNEIQIVQGQKEYTVKSGDTLWAISIKTNIKVDTLAKASGITNPNEIQIGQKIILDGNHMMVKDSDGKTIGMKTLHPSDKVVQSQDYGTPVKTASVEQVTQETSTSSIAPNTDATTSTSNSTTNVATSSTDNGNSNQGSATTPSTDNGSSDQGTTTTPSTDNGSSDQGSTTTPSTDNGSSDQGSTTTPSTDNGSSDQGSTTTPSTDNGNSDQGSTTTPNTDNGSSDQGSTTTPSTDSGSSDQGSTTTPSTDNGSSDQGSTTTPSTDNDSSSNQGSTTTPSTDNGNSDQGSTMTPSTDNGSSDQGSTTTPSTDNGSSDQGSTTTPSTDNGSSDQGSTTTPSTDNGNQTTTDSLYTDPSDTSSFLNEEGLKQAENDFIALLNQMREEKGLNALQNGSHMQADAEVRGEENAKSFETTGDFDKHVRPDGSSGVTAITGTGWKGEVEAMKFLVNDGGNTPEDVASVMLKDLASDEAHYDILMDKDFQWVGVSIKSVVTKTGSKIYALVADFLG
ncbi:LysM peptidoglycan-binding domain-containing protein (plasmid) [Limosilactobacillus reuteri]|uniref:LysM peptidoglycan-binding domain-containing protein n=1 Tax=Limosilactobacillus reuteri TaxID=1598 RepID=A0A517D8D5_LIMRT|nr:LysM peptidoglycan-binding domain-containing protein [Limosilactobacillus reuteri]QDR73606.1 LysM peptidoglycan-binding domain-containing protein [Limosilactobacillus reuteri]